MSVRQKILVGAAGFTAFVIACASAATLQTIMGGLIQSKTPDPPGKLEPTPEEKSKQEWEASQQAKAEESSADKPQKETDQSSTQDAQPSPEQSASSASVPAPATLPLPVASGPGNFDSFSKPLRNFSGTTGPGNM